MRATATMAGISAHHDPNRQEVPKDMRSKPT
jgi:hypothetical protein